MVKLVFCCRRRPELSPEQFRRTWLDRHGSLVRSLRTALPMMRRYVQSHTLEGPANEAIRASRGSREPYDGITEVWFDSLEAMAGSSEATLAAGKRLLEDERTFIDLANSSVFLTEEHEIF